jgi:hypothetical protein
MYTQRLIQSRLYMQFSDFTFEGKIASLVDIIIKSTKPMAFFREALESGE